jgi:hypothetical protein
MKKVELKNDQTKYFVKLKNEGFMIGEYFRTKDNVINFTFGLYQIDEIDMIAELELKKVTKEIKTGKLNKCRKCNGFGKFCDSDCWRCDNGYIEVIKQVSYIKAYYREKYIERCIEFQNVEEVINFENKYEIKFDKIVKVGK